MNDHAQNIEPGAAAPGRRLRNKQEKLARIRAAAQRLFASQGFDATTTRQIAEEADIGAGTLFLYAKSKEELLVLVFQDDMVRVNDESFSTLPEDASLLDEIFHVFRAMCEFHERDRDLGRVYAKELGFVRGANRQGVRDYMDSLFEGLAGRVEVAKSRGEVAEDVPSRTLASNLFATYFTHLQHALGDDLPLMSPEQLDRLRAALALQLRGLGPSN